MPSKRDAQTTIRLYLLGRLDGDAREEFERRLLTEDDLIIDLEALEDELSDEYIADSLDQDDKELFEKNFLTTPERQRKLQFARALRQYSKTHLLEEPAQLSKPLPSSWSWAKLFNNPYIRTAAFACLIVSAALGVWRIFFFQSDVEKGLLALNAAYRDQRPVKARITQLDYAPFVITRGGEPERVNSQERDYAHRYLMDAARERPGATTYHAVGKFYLTTREFDKAIPWLENAIRDDQNNAQIYADLGAAFLEKGRLQSEKGQTDKVAAAAGMEDLARSRENFAKALSLNPNLLEALYNRALVNELQILPEQAKSDWLEYLKRDPESPWAREAREHLEKLELRRGSTNPSKEEALTTFLSAYESKDGAAAWAALRLSRGREGNKIVEVLIDDYLSLATSGGVEQSADKLRQVSFAGKVEKERVGDRYTSDLARFYGGTSPHQWKLIAAARSLMKAGHQLYGKAEFDQASSNYSRARELFVQAGDQCEGLLAESWVGYSYVRIPKPAQSIQIFERLSRDFEAKNYTYLLAQSFPALADAESSRNEFSKTLDYGYRGLKLSQEIEDRETGIRCLGQIVSMHLALGDYKQSLEALTQAVNLAHTLPLNPRLTWQLYYQAALDFHFLKFPASALAFAEEALRLAETSGVSLLKSRSWERMGVLYGEQKDYDQAIRCGERALAEANAINDEKPKTNVQAYSLLTLGKLRADAGKLDQAIANFDQSIDLYKKLDFDAYSYEAYKGKMLVSMARSDDSAADAELLTVLTLFEKYRDKISDLGSRDTFFDAGQDTYDIAVDFAYSRRRDPGRAYEYAENSRARSLFEMMNSGARIVGDSEKLEIKLEPQTRPLTRQQIQMQMPEQAQILQYSLLADKVIAWVITKSRLESRSLPISSSELSRQIENYWTVHAKTNAQTTETTPILAKQLYATLITPLETLLSKDLQLCIVADKDLNYVPFAALMSSTGKYLVEDFAIQMSPSASVFVWSSQQANKRSKMTAERVLSIGNPSFDRRAFPELASLPTAETEARRVGDFYPSHTVLIGDDAQARRVKTEMASADVIHFATHAVADKSSPLLSKLLLAGKDPDRSSHHAGDGFLQASDIYQQELSHARLVVLSACQTSIERAYRGEGAIGLARPFLASGVPIVVASLWPVDSDVTEELMISFHKHRRQNKRPTVEALRQAQLEMIGSSQPGTARGNGWAAFVAIGGYADF